MPKLSNQSIKQKQNQQNNQTGNTPNKQENQFNTQTPKSYLMTTQKSNTSQTNKPIQKAQVSVND